MPFSDNITAPLTVAEINLNQLCENYKIIKAAVPGSRVICIVKADAYGHGAVRCARALTECGADFFGVANLNEAAELRQNGICGDILILGYTPPSAASFLVRQNIIQTVFSSVYAHELSGALPPGEVLSCHMKIDTGMNRIGFGVSDTDGMLDAYRLPNLNFSGIFTHFACSDTPASPMTAMQYRRFNEVTEMLAARGAAFDIKHASNSAAIVNFPEMKLDAVRAGIILYGFRPSNETGTGGCRPVMTLRTTVSHVHYLNAGESVSYGAIFTAERPMKIATLTIGYADGFVRAYAGREGARGGVCIAGRRAPIVGRICMDQCMVDVTDIDGVTPGMSVTVFDSEHTADLLAEAAGTINYEVTSILTRRVKREYI